jgi:diguanylate cyclase
MKKLGYLFFTIIVLVTLTFFTITLPIGSSSHDLIIHSYYLFIALIALWYRKWLFHTVYLLISIHIITDLITHNAFPMHSLRSSLSQVVIAILLFFILKQRDESTKAHQSLIGSMKLGLAHCEIMYDEHNKPTNYRFIYVNQSFANLFNLVIKDFIGKTIKDIIPNTKQEYIDGFAEVANTGVPSSAMNYSTALDKWFDTVAYSPKKNQFAMILHDITDRVKLQEALDLEHQRVSRLVGSTADIIFEIDLEKSFKSIHGKGLEKLHLKAEDFIGKKILDVFGSDGIHRDKMYQRALEGEANIYDWQIEIDGSIFYFESSISPIFDQSQNVIGAVGVSRDITEPKNLQFKLQNSYKSLQNIIAGTGAGTWEWDIKEDVLYFNQRFADLLGRTLEDISPLPADDYEKFIHEEDYKRVKQVILSVIDKTIESISLEYRLKRSDGTYIWILDNGKVMAWDEEGNPLTMAGTNIDITSIKETENALNQEKIKAETTLLSIGDAVISTDEEGKILVFNDIAQSLTGYTKEEAVNQPFNVIFNIVDEHTHKPLPNPVDLVLKRKEKLSISRHAILISKDHERYLIEDSCAPIFDENKNLIGTVLVFRDVTEQALKQREIEYLSIHDYLTGLFNRRYYSEELAKYDHESYYPLGIMNIDLNGLKLLNDAFGHETGDIALKQIASTLLKSCRTKDIIARIGGDEFAIILPNTDEEEIASIKYNIQSNIMHLKIENVHYSLAIGYAVKDNPHISIKDILKRAEDDMYKRKLTEGKSMRNQAIKSILNTLTDKYSVEKIHSERVSQYCKRMGEVLDLRTDEIKELELAGMLHDIGKISIPDAILDKPASLTEEEYHIIKQHTENGYQILRAADEFSDLAEYALSHHERYDGLGYPNGLAGEDIPYFSRIISIVDAYEAMTSNRPYRKSIGKDNAIKELIKYSGIQFDPELVKVFIEKVIK